MLLFLMWPKLWIEGPNNLVSIELKALPKLYFIKAKKHSESKCYPYASNLSLICFNECSLGFFPSAAG